jgi:metaxin
MPDQAAYDQALAVAQLVLGRLHPAYVRCPDPSLKTVLTISQVASMPKPKQSQLHLLLSTPPALAAGLSTPLPASLTGDERDVDAADLTRKGIEAIDSLQVLLADRTGWALGAACVV